MDELKIIVPAIIIIIGWFISNWLSARRDSRSKIIELRFNYLIDAHRAISSAACRQESDLTNEQRLGLETAIEDIQLLGNEEQLKELGDVLDSSDRDFNKLLIVLRKELRTKLNFPKNNTVRFFRIK